MLRHLSQKALCHLSRLFNHILRLQHFPNSWKNAEVVPILKPNKPPTEPSSYRPISLLSMLSKLFERVLTARLTSFVNQRHLLPNVQFGFRKKLSTVAQLARITDFITNGFNLHKHTGMILLDIEKAYDSVDSRFTVQARHPQISNSLTFSLQNILGRTNLHGTLK